MNHLPKICLGMVIAIPSFLDGQTNSIPGNPVVVQGNLGIGVIAPNTPLSVATTVLADAPAITMTNVNAPAGGVGVNLQATSGGGSEWLGAISFGGAGTAGHGGLLDFYTSIDGSLASLPRMRIGNDGNVGIGILDPVTPLHVGTSVLADAPAITMTNVNAPAGGVGVNLQATSGGGSEWLGAISFGGAGTAGHGGVLDFYTSIDGSTAQLPRMRIDNNGNVGIGTADPVSKLHVAGNIQIAGTGNGIIFPDGSVQESASVSGPTGPQGPAGPSGGTVAMCVSNAVIGTGSGCRYRTISFQSAVGGGCNAAAATGSCSAVGTSVSVPGQIPTEAVCAVCAPN